MTTTTVLVLPPWLPWLFVCAASVGFALGMIHMVTWPGQVTLQYLPVWVTQVIGTSAIWIGFTVFSVFALGTWAPSLILAVFIVFAGAIPLGLRAIRHYAEMRKVATSVAKEING